MPKRSESNISYKEAGAPLDVLQEESLCKVWRGKILILFSFLFISRYFIISL